MRIKLERGMTEKTVQMQGKRCQNQDTDHIHSDETSTSTRKQQRIQYLLETTTILLQVKTSNCDLLESVCLESRLSIPASRNSTYIGEAAAVAALTALGGLGS